jgi:hypothetical protein
LGDISHEKSGVSPRARRPAIAGGPFAFGADDPAAAKKEKARREVVWNNPDGPARPGITHHVLASPSMQRDVGYNVFLPAGYESTTMRYPMIYFLHGAGGNENSETSSQTNPLKIQFPTN